MCCVKIITQLTQTPQLDFHSLFLHSVCVNLCPEPSWRAARAKHKNIHRLKSTQTTTRQTTTKTTTTFIINTFKLRPKFLLLKTPLKQSSFINRHICEIWWVNPLIHVIFILIKPSTDPTAQCGSIWFHPGQNSGFPFNPSVFHLCNPVAMEANCKLDCGRNSIDKMLYPPTKGWWWEASARRLFSLTVSNFLW